jgi:hypothetical protein
MKKQCKHKELLDLLPERIFKGYKISVLHGTKQYIKIIELKTILSLKGYKSHPNYFDIVIKEDRNYFILDII